MPEQLLVVYDYGSLPPVRLAEAAAENDCDLVFVTAGTDHAREMRPLLETLGAVVDASGGMESALVQRLGRFEPAGIVTFSESQISATAQLANALVLPFQAPGILGPIINKKLQRRRLTESGVDVIRFHEVTRIEDVDGAIAKVGLPAMVKPTVGASSKNTTAAHTRAGCLAAVAEIIGPGRSALVEELLIGCHVAEPWGDYIAVDCVATGDAVHPVFVTSKFALATPFRERGGYGQASVVPEPVIAEARELACRAVRALGIRIGLADVEMKLTKAGPRVIEVNGRLGGWVDDLAVRSGSADPAGIAIKSALGRRVTPPADRPKDRIAFHYLVIPPPEAASVSAVTPGLYDLRALESVAKVAITAYPGMPVDWRHGAETAVASVLGETDSHEQLAELVDRIENTSWIDYDRHHSSLITR